MGKGILEFPEGKQGSVELKTPLALVPPPASKNPYSDSLCPNDIMDLLLPNGELFGLYSDPYATLRYHKPGEGLRNGRFWLEERVDDGTFTEREIRLLEFLSTVRVATRNQIRKAVFKITDDEVVVKEFLRKCRRKGILCAFNWVSPLKSERKKPLVYAMTRIAVSAAQMVLKRNIHDDFWFQPIEIQPGRGPEMGPLFQDLISAELYAELTHIDRLINWQRTPLIRLQNGQIHHPTATFEVIKDANDIKLFWLETIRVGQDWVSKTRNRFQKIKIAYDNVSEYQRPLRIIIVADGDSRISFLEELSKQYLPDIEVRFTTDERIIAGLGEETFLNWNQEKGEPIAKRISFLQPGAPGMTASEYRSAQFDAPDDDDYDE